MYNTYVVNGPKTSALVWCSRQYGMEPFLLPRTTLFSSITFFKNWGVLEKPMSFPEGTPIKNRYWQLTKRGFNFTRGKLRIPERVIVYNDCVLKELDGKISVQEALGKGGFDLDAVMSMTASLESKEFSETVQKLFDAYREDKRKKKGK